MVIFLATRLRYGDCRHCTTPVSQKKVNWIRSKTWYRVRQYSLSFSDWLN